ncbi:membrane hypothetical protein [Acidobacteriia bacterium SbA2]|nr:membrane hypothetical protein [Acidobacteriia bacterium SbA2]
MTQHEVQHGIESRTPLKRVALSLLLLLIATALVAPVWSVRYVPLVDYPNHLASAFVLAHLKDPAFHFSHFYASDWNTYPYLTMDVILVGLQRFLPIDLAGRLLLSLCLLGVPAATWFFIRQANPGQESLALWSLLVTNNLYFFLFGLVNLQLSLALCLVVIGFWLRFVERPRWPLWCLLLILTTALYFTHLMGFGMACLVMTAYALFARQPLRLLWRSWFLFLPGLVLYLHSRSSGGGLGLHYQGLAGKVGGLLLLMAAYSPVLDFMTLLAILLTFALVITVSPDFRWNTRWLGVLGCVFGLYWVFPSSFRAAMKADIRLLPFAFVLGLASVKLGRRARTIGLIAVVLFLVRAGEVERRFRSVQPHLEQLSESFSAIPEGARVLPVIDWWQARDALEGEFWAYGVIRRGWFSPCLFHDPGVHPFRIKLQAYTPCSPNWIPLEAWDWSRIRNEFDYAWVYGAPQALAPLSGIGRIASQQSDLRVYQLCRAACGGQP